MTEKYVSISELADHLAVSIPTIRVWMSNKTLPSECYLKIAKTYRFKISEVEASFKKSEKKEAPIEFSDEMVDLDF